LCGLWAWQHLKINLGCFSERCMLNLSFWSFIVLTFKWEKRQTWPYTLYGQTSSIRVTRRVNENLVYPFNLGVTGIKQEGYHYYQVSYQVSGIINTRENAIVELDSYHLSVKCKREILICFRISLEIG